MELAQIKVYRITNIENIPHILQYGITHKNSAQSNKNFINIGDISLIDARKTKKVSINNGDYSNLDVQTIVLGEFIPFYFNVKMPMLFVVQNGGNFVERATPPENIVYLVCPIIKIIQSNCTYYFTDGHATDNLTTFYDKNKIDELPTIIDWKAIRSPYWGGQENLNIKRKKQAEFLVSNDLPPEFIIGFGCYNETAKNKLITQGVDEKKIRVIPGAYY